MTRPNERPLADVLQDIVSNTQEIIRSEFHLAKAEITEEAAKASKPAVTMLIGTLLGVYAGGFALLAGVYALSKVMDPWMAALAVAAAVGFTATLLFHTRMNGLRRVKAPEKTVQSVKETMEWTKDRIK